MMCRTFIKNSLLLCLLLFAYPASANIGKIIYSYGSNYALGSEGERRSIKKGSVINEGDTLFTGQGRLQLRFLDGGFVSIYPNSEYKIEKYKFSGAARNSKKANVKEVAESKEDRGFFSLLKGAARQVTGLLGSTHNKNFRFKTSIATIGIRGTGFFVRLCQADCFDENGNAMADGMYVKNNTGIITMATTVGEVSLAQGQSAFAATSVDSPQQTIQAPMVYNLVTQDVEQYDFDEKANIDSPVTVIAPTPAPTLNITKLEYVANNSVLFNAINTLDTTDTMNGVNTVSVVGDAIKGFNGTTVGADLVTIPVVFDKSLATKVEFGSDAALGVLWNRWEGGYSYTENGQTLASLDNNIHLIGAEQLTQNVPTAGMATYTSVGGTSPTIAGFAGNQVGTQTVTATIDYGAGGFVNDMSIQTVFPDGTSMEGVNSLTTTALVGASTTIGLTVLCTGTCGAMTPVTGFGEATINLVGPNAEGIFGAYNMTTGITNEENTVSGTYFAK